MKRQFFTLFTTGVLCASLTAGAFAGSPQLEFDKAKVIAKLEQRARRLEWDAQTTKGAGRQELELQRFRVRKLIKRIEAGEDVDRQEILRLLGEGPQ